MKVRKSSTAAKLLMLGILLYACTGCRTKGNENLETLLPEETLEQEDAGRAENTEVRDEPEEPEAERVEEQKLYVYVCGAVQRPGVYELEPGARVYQAVASAGGVRDDASEESVNQARAVADGEYLYIPTREEVSLEPDRFRESGGADGNTNPQEGTADTAAAEGSAGADRKIDINIASKEELKTLNGIGDTRAESIVAYREKNGPFQSIEDLKKVDGIKDGVFQKIKDGITVNAGS